MNCRMWNKAAYILSTWFYAGRFPVLPGTVGSAAALPLAWLVHRCGGGPWHILALAAVVTVVGLIAVRQVLKTSVSQDPGWVVIDEVAGQLIAACTGYYLAAFLLFRAFDMVKPPPVGIIDRRVKGAGGVMLDDLAAGVMALAVIQLYLQFFK